MNLLSLCLEGAWFCGHCERFVRPLGDVEPGPQPIRCPMCHRATCTWLTPSLGPDAAAPAIPLANVK